MGEMIWPISLFVFLYINSALSLQIIDATPTAENQSKTDAPIIGVLAQEISYHLNQQWPGQYSSYIAASYIKFIEGGGARAVPIWIGKSRAYYEVMLSQLNGILLPGGATWFNQSNGYATAGAHIFDIAKQMNDNGIHFPLFGTCLGFELLLFVSNNRTEYRVICSSMKQSLPLDFTEDFKQSRLFGAAPDDVIEILRSEAVTPNFHTFCLTRKKLAQNGLDREWNVLSVNRDSFGLEFVSSIEHKRYPFYGVQFHPEKNLYEWIRNRNIAHSSNAILAAQYFATFLVNEARKNDNHFGGVDEENRVLIYNFEATFTGLKKSAFEQSYLFKDTTDYPGPNSNFDYSNTDDQIY